MIHDELVTYEVAKSAKEKGFPLQKVVEQDGRAFFYELPQSHPNWANGPNVHFILVFPTEEMRDMFYENFKDLIEECKELL